MLGAHVLAAAPPLRDIVALAGAPGPSAPRRSPTKPTAPSGDSNPIPVPPPDISVPSAPEPLQPAVGLASPVSFFTCQYLGLLPLAAALSGALGSPVPLTALLPYMRPLFDACLLFGVPATETTCATDQQIDDGASLPPVPVALDLTLGEVVQGVPVPHPEGLAIDLIEQLERFLLGEPAATESRPSDSLVAALDCRQR